MADGLSMKVTPTAPGTSGIGYHPASTVVADPPTTIAPDQADDDAAELRRLGYAQQLRRSMGPFSSFAVAFSLISVFTGVFANFGHGLRHVGGAIVWSWLVVLAGQMLLALVLAELSTRFPISGYGYQWTSRLVNPHFGFFVGWALTMQFLAGFPGVCATLASATGSALGGAWAEPRYTTALTLAVIAVTTVLHLYGIRLVSRVNDAGVWTEGVGVVLVSGSLIAVAWWSGAPVGRLLDSTSASTGQAATAGHWALSLLVGAWCLTGFEAAADLAEETQSPRRVVPRAMLMSLASAGIGGFLLLAGLLLAVPDLSDAQHAADPLRAALDHALGPRLTPVVLVVVCVSVFACALSSMAATSRLLFALGRDRMLPGGSWLAHVAEGHHTPRNAILFTWVVTSVVVLLVPTLDLITQISAVAGYLGYAGIVVAALSARLPPAGGDAVFGLGRARPWIAVAALAWTLGLVAALTIPATDIPGVGPTHWPAQSTAAALTVGALIYFFVVRGRLLRGDAGPPHGD